MKQALNTNGKLEDCIETTEGEFRCAHCGAVIEVRNDKKFADGRVRDYYFAHAGKSSCSVESYIHSIAKLIIQQHNAITLPDGKGIREYTSVEIECRDRWLDYRPDALIEADLVVEVCYRNPKTDHEKNILRGLNLDAIELDLSALTEQTDHATFVRAVLHDPENRTYLWQRKEPVPRTTTRRPRGPGCSALEDCYGPLTHSSPETKNPVTGSIHGQRRSHAAQKQKSGPTEKPNKIYLLLLLAVTAITSSCFPPIAGRSFFFLTESTQQ